MRQFFTLSATLALLTACGGNDSNEAATTDAASDNVAATPSGSMAPAGTASPDAPTGAADYAAKAGAGDKWEIDSSKALLAKSTNAEVKKFAQMMVDHHTRATDKVKAAAKSAGITIPAPTLDAMQQQMLDEIKKADAASIDAVYVKHQKTAHDAALKLHQGHAQYGDNAQFKKAAGEIAPVVQEHINSLSNLKAY